MIAPLTICALGYPTVLLEKTNRRGQELVLEAQLQLRLNALTYLVTGPDPQTIRIFTKLQAALDYYNEQEVAMDLPREE